MKYKKAKDIKKNDYIKYNGRYRFVEQVNFDIIKNLKNEIIPVVKIKFLGYKRLALIGIIYVDDMVQYK